MRQDDAIVRRGLLRKLVILTAGFFAIKSKDAIAFDKEKNQSPSNNNTNSIALNNLSIRETKSIGELIYISDFIEGSNVYNSNNAFSGFFTSAVKVGVRPDGYIHIQGPNCIWSRVINDCIYVEWFGARGDGVIDDSHAIYLANQCANNYGLPLKFSPNKKYLVSQSFQVDIARSSWHGGERSVLQWAKSPDGYALRVFSSQSVYSRTRVNNKVALSNLTILGGGIRDLYTSKAITVGGVEKSSSLFSFKNINIQGWEVNLYFDDNSWRIKVEDCLFLWGKILSKPQAVNSGECMFFSNCMFADNFSSTELHTGDWHYVSCSIDNHEIKVFGDACIYFDNGHIENPGRKNKKFTALGIYSENGSASVTNTRLIISSTPKIITTPIFYVMDKNKSLGLYINNLRYDQKHNFDPSLSDVEGVFLVGGEGKVVIDNMFTNMIDSNFVALSKTSNILLVNQDFKSNLQGWDSSGHVIVQNNVCRVSHNCLLLSGKSSVQQKIIIQSDEVITGGVWAKLSSNDNAILRISIKFIDPTGKAIISEGYEFSKKTEFDWEWIRLGAVSPKNVQYCLVSIFLESGPEGRSEAYIDGLVINKANR
ncbi:TPA: hypothetical protein ACTYEH_001258 [Raoultella ornithinolytica]|uniref:hypothetical protein n=1 Tax=Raoultella ornithinolytica TaxID=54291 RepID=UPI003D99AC37